MAKKKQNGLFTSQEAHVEALRDVLERFDHGADRFETETDTLPPRERFARAAALASRYLTDRELDLLSWRIEVQLYMRYIVDPTRKPRQVR